MQAMKLGKVILVGLLIWVLLLLIIFSKNSESSLPLAFPSMRTDPVRYSNVTTRTLKRPHSTRAQHTRVVQLVEKKQDRTNNVGKPQKTLKLDLWKIKKKRSDDWEENFSNGKKVVYGLWIGSVSSSMLSLHLQNAKKNYRKINSYNVTSLQQQRKQKIKQELLCQIKKQGQVRELDAAEEPFASLGWGQLVPSQPLEKLQGTPYRTCAIVSSAGAILSSSLGDEIDSHDAVLRFNAAPTVGYEKDVGSKTTFQIINSLIMAKPQYNFTENSLFKNVILVAWDPASYSADLQKWYKSPEFDFFTVYKDYRRRFPDQPFYILHPKFIWGLWNMLQENSDEDIQPNPPSSGFTGIVLMMNLCERIDVYEFIPSKRHTTLCHYYSKYRDMACTLGAYHPLLFEKLLVRKMATTSFSDLSNKGKVTLPGVGLITCLP